ncbi:MAG TPA: hypothetical protein PLC65_05555 [Bacteroidia bacterium]|nr:hypothetical protein [Bacteroidia bacterium]
MKNIFAFDTRLADSLRTGLFFALCCVLTSCVDKSVKTEDQNNTTIEKSKLVRTFPEVTTFDEFVNAVKKFDTINYKDVDKILNLKSFIKEDLPDYIAVAPPPDTLAYNIDSIHTSVKFWLMSKDSFLNGTFYDVDLIFRKKEIVSFILFSHPSSKYEIQYFKDKDVFKLLYGRKSEEGGFVSPGDSTRLK